MSLTQVCSNKLSLFNLVGIMLLAINLGGCDSGGGSSEQNVDNTQSPSNPIIRGQASYQNLCAVCHADQVDGSFDFEEKEIYSQSDIVDFIKKIEEMGRIKECSQSCATDIAAYIASYHSFPVRHLAFLGCSDALICENFDNGELIGWAIENDVEHTMEEVFSGTHSLKVTSANEFGRSLPSSIGVDLAQDYSRLELMMWGRVMMKPGDEPGLPGDFTFVAARGLAKASSGAPEGSVVTYRLGLSDNTADNRKSLVASYDTWIDEDGNGSTDWQTGCYQQSEVSLPEDAWSCIEWHFDSEFNELVVWLNGAEVISVNDTGDGCIGMQQGGEWTGPEAFDQLRVGVEQQSGVDRHTLYIDDIKVDSRRVGCPASN